MKFMWMSCMAVLVAGSPIFMQAQDTPAAVAPNGIAHVALRVSDLDAEVNFFGKLGFEKAFADTGNNGQNLQILIKINDQTFIQLYPQNTANHSLGFMHVSYEAQDVKALNAKYASEGLKPGSVQQDGAGDLWFNLMDPEGRPTEFTQYLANSRQASDVGQHLGADRVSDELIGFELPVRDVEASQKFYTQLGFEAQAEGTTVRLGLPGNPEVHIVLQPARPNSQPQFLFPIDDARKTADELQKAGLQVQRSNKLVFVHDGDGNAFVLLESGDHSPRHSK
jgi:catechol 2,3-dioxygenase-like lactoylglutathione lyase family enzyme